jgi:hypothetical protein
MSHVDSAHPGTWWKWYFESSSPTHNPSLIMKETSDKYRLKEILQNIWPPFFKIAKVIKNKENVKKLF